MPQSDFNTRELLGRNNYKDAHRDQVIEFFADPQYHDQNNWRMLCLPYLWKTEKKILEQYPRATFIGVERDPRRFEQARVTAPGTAINTYPGGYCAFTDKAVLVRSELATLSTRYPAHETNITCAWIDTCSQLSKGLVSFMQQLPAFFDQKRKHIPVVLTVIKGREAFGVLDDLKHYGMDRATYIADQAGNGWVASVVDSIEYNSDNNCPMQLIFMRYSRLSQYTKPVAAALKAARTRRSNKNTHEIQTRKALLDRA